MSVRMRLNRSKTGKRRSHLKAEAPRLSSCPDCGEARRPHTACGACGRYRGRVVVDMTAKYAKQERKRKEREEELRQQGMAPQGGDAEQGESSEEARPASAEELSRKN